MFESGAVAFYGSENEELWAQLRGWHSSLVLPVLGIVDHSKQAPDHAKEAVKGILNNLDGCLDVYQGTMPSPPCYSFLK